MSQDTKRDIKDRIRERYRGGDTDNMTLIPARPKESIFDEFAQRRVCAYCRVSTDDPRQTSSYELQKNHYEEFIREHPGWVLVDIYADEGITGTSMDKRDEFNRMLADIRQGKIELVLCKSVARFARNVVDSLSTVRMLLDMKPPVGVFFEAEHINTLDSSSEMMLSLLSMTAQEESHNKSEIMNISIEQRFRRGVLLTPTLLGYDWDDNHRLKINPEEALTVRLAYTMLLAGCSKKEIAATLNDLGRPSKLGNINWSAGSVTGLLRNERYCGDVLARKTFTPNYLTHRSRKNRQDRNQYLWHNQHDAIVSPEDWRAAQTILNICRNGGSGTLPALRVISEGALQGFVSVNRRQAWDDLETYTRASLSAYGGSFSETTDQGSGNGDAAPEKPDPASPGGYQVVRGSFFFDHHPAVTVSRDALDLNRLCLERLGAPAQVEILLNPVERLLAVRPCAADCPNAIGCGDSGKGEKCAVRASVFAGILMDLMGWNRDYRYRIRGHVRRTDRLAVMFFDLYEPEVRIRLTGADGVVKRLKGYPAEWAGTFGLAAFEQFSSLRLPEEGLVGLDAAGQAVNLHGLPELTRDDVAAVLKDLGNT